MPLVNGDYKQLEWMGAVYLSKEVTGYDEICKGVDQHADNQRIFGLPNRLIAKTFVFRLIYGGTAYAYANDANFAGTSTDEGFWSDVITKFYQKYAGIKKWHEWLVEEVMKTGRIVSPTGRIYTFQKEWNKWPRPKILNYPVQGFGADLMILARLGMQKRLRGLADILFVSTVHDSIMLDVSVRNVDRVVRTFFETWQELPTDFEQRFKIPLDLPQRVEVGVGPNWKDLKEVKE